MINLGLLGAGRIGQVHAKAVAAHPNARIKSVYDPISEAAARILATPASIEEILADPDIDGVLVCTPSDQHAAQIVAAVDAGKAVFCEKPIATDVAATAQTLEHVKAVNGLLMLGFQRRFDPNFRALKSRLSDMGNLEQVVITSRDPAAPPYSYMLSSGGLFKDMMIHDFDVARWLLGEEFVSVYAAGSALTDPKVATEGQDIDTASVVMTTASGRQVTILNSRRASYGYDQRIEVHCERGMVQAQSVRENTVVVSDQDGIAERPLQDFFMTRYVQAYADEIVHFVDSLSAGTQPEVSGNDGLQALRLAQAAGESLRTGQVVRL